MKSASILLTATLLLVAVMACSRFAYAGGPSGEQQDGDKKDSTTDAPPLPPVVDPESFIVLFQQDAPEEAVEAAKERVLSAGGSIQHVYDSNILPGFSAKIPTGLVSVLEGMPGVELVQPDQEVSIYN